MPYGDPIAMTARLLAEGHQNASLFGSQLLFTGGLLSDYLLSVALLPLTQQADASKALVIVDARCNQCKALCNLACFTLLATTYCCPVMEMPSLTSTGCSRKATFGQILSSHSLHIGSTDGQSNPHAAVSQLCA
jgi:hypothetical protein